MQVRLLRNLQPGNRLRCSATTPFAFLLQETNEARVNMYNVNGTHITVKHITEHKQSCYCAAAVADQKRGYAHITPQRTCCSQWRQAFTL